MKMNKDLLTLSYDYDLPKELIAKYPINPPDMAKLLVYDRSKDKITHTIFREFLEFLPKDTVVFLNDTKVIKARIFGKKQSGGRIELLLLKPLSNNCFSVMIRGKVKEGSLLYFDLNLKAKVIALNNDGSRVVEFYAGDKKLNFTKLIAILEQIGHVPLPPYIDRADEKEDEKNYQTLFAKKEGSVAAPTASLHFSKELFEKMQQKFETQTLTLHVGAGTFKSVESEIITKHTMHSEYFAIPKGAAKVIESKKKILAIGTTATRTIEYYVREKKLSGECDLFLHPLNPPKRVNFLLTNFHLPKSTLIMLVSSFIGREKTLAIYQEAIEKRYRFFSYGDAMLIL